MSRTVKEWIGRNDNAMPPQTVFDRLWDKQGGKDALTGLPFTASDQIVRDHIIPLIDGGENRESNLQLITAERHKVKTAQEATARSDVRRTRGKDRGYQREAKSGFATNRNAKFKRRMDGTIVLRSTGEVIQ